MRNEYISTHAIRVKIIVSRRSVVAVLSSSFLPPPPPLLSSLRSLDLRVRGRPGSSRRFSNRDETVKQ